MRSLFGERMAKDVLIALLDELSDVEKDLTCELGRIVTYNLDMGRVYDRFAAGVKKLGIL